MRLCGGGTHHKCKEWRMESHNQLANDFDRVIMKEDSSSSVTEGLQQFQTVRERISHILEGYRFQLIVVSLVIFDCLLVISELLIDIRILELNEEPVDAIKVIHGISIGILSLFILEIAVKVYAFRLEFFRQKWEVFDAVVIVVSFAMDIAFRESHNAVNGTGLIIILRLWRVARILNGIVMSVKIQAERKLHRERRAKEALEQELQKYRDYCALQEQEIEALHGLLRKHGIEVASSEAPPISGVRMDVVAEVNESLLDKDST